MNDSPHIPEQIHIAMAGVGAMSVNWVTNPQEDDILMLSSRSEHYCDRLADLQLNSTVLYGTKATSLVSISQGDYSCYTADEYQSGALHHVTLGLGPEGPLKANTQYFYQVGDAQLALSDLYSFITPPEVGANSLPYRLGVIGDLGQTENSMDTLDHAATLQPVSVLNVGDLSYADGYQPRWDSFGRLIQSSAARIPWQVIEGNHEQEVVDGKLGFLAYEKRFHTPSTFSESNTNLYYSFEVAGLHVIMLGCYADYSRKSQQYAWLERDLAKVDRSRTPWLIVGMHAPWYNSNVAHQGEMEDMRNTMEGLLFEYGVDAVFSGHVHAYERSLRVYQGHVNELGPVYINIGDGGNREGLSNAYIKPSPQWSAFREPSYGMGVLNVLNSTHAVWQWHRNQDGMVVVGDDIDIIRGVQSQISVAMAPMSCMDYIVRLFRHIYMSLHQLMQPAVACMFT